MARQWFSEGVQVYEEGLEQFFVEGVQLSEDQGGAPPATNRRRRFFILRESSSMIPVRQSTAFELAIGPVLDADGVAVTGCVVGDFKIKKTTGNFAALNGSATLTHVSAGMYDLVLTTSDTDTVGLATVAIDDTVNACAPVYLQVIEEAVYDAHYAASALGYVANAPVNVEQFGGTNGTFDAGKPEVKLHSDSRDAIVEDSLAAYADDVGTSQAGGASSITLQSGAVATDDYYNGAVVKIRGGPGAGQSRRITDYVGSTRVATVDSAWAVQPDNSSSYFIIGRIV